KIKICKFTEYSCEPSGLVVNVNADSDKSSANAPKLMLSKHSMMMVNSEILFMVRWYSLKNDLI
ncbi:MAG: hypothetical protein ACI952_001996, partial [Flavobacteriales bacterium]